MGSWHGGCVTNEGKLYMWGRGEWGNLGCGKKIQVIEAPRQVKGALENEVVRTVCCSIGNINPIVGPGKDGIHTLVTTEQGRVYSFGTGNKGRLGNLWGKWSMHMGGKEDELAPYLIGGVLRDCKPTNGIEKESHYLGGEPMVAVECGNDLSLALSAGGRLYSWGDGSNGKCGLRRFVTGNKTCKFFVSAPELVEELWDASCHVKQVAASRGHCAVIVL